MIPRISIVITMMLVLWLNGCRGRDTPFPQADPTTSTIIVFNLLGSSISSVGVSYGQHAVNLFDDVPLRDSGYFSQSGIPALPTSGDSVHVTYRIGGETVQREVVVSPQLFPRSVPVIVLLLTEARLEWHRGDKTSMDLMDEIVAKYRR